MNYFEGVIKVANNLPYHIDVLGSWVNEEDIIHYLCANDDVFYMKYFMGETYLSLKEIDGKFPLLNALIAIHEVFEIIADKESKNGIEIAYEKLLFPFIMQLAKIGAKELGGNRPPLQVMEEMLSEGN